MKLRLPGGGGRRSSLLYKVSEAEHHTKKTIYDFAVIWAIAPLKNDLCKVALLQLNLASNCFFLFKLCISLRSEASGTTCYSYFNSC